jgi:hypothetical protein
MVFFALALSILVFNTGDVVTLATMIPGWAIVMIFTLWPVITHLMRKLLDLVAILVHQPQQVAQYLLGYPERELQRRDTV